MSVCTTRPNGANEWLLEGGYALHRLDGPAIECPVRQERRLNGPAVGEATNKWWYLWGRCHRLDGPAVEYANGSTEWYVGGERHRLDGRRSASRDASHRPAVEWVDEKGNRLKLQWYFEGHELTEQQHTRIRLRVEKARAAKAHRIKWFIHLLRKVTT